MNLGLIPAHRLHLAGEGLWAAPADVVQLPGRFQLGFNLSYASAPPFSAFVGGSDFNGEGTTDDLLPGTTVNAFNRGLGRAELDRLVTQFNQTYAGKVDAKGDPIPQLVLPGRYSFGDNFQSLDLRLSRSFVFEKRWRFLSSARCSMSTMPRTFPATAAISPVLRSAGPTRASRRSSARAALGPFSWGRGLVFEIGRRLVVSVIQIQRHVVRIAGP